MESLNALLQGMGLMHLGAGQAIMLLVSLLLLWLAIAKKFEPLLLLPIGFGGLLSNIPEAGMALTALESLLAHHDAGQLAVIAAKLNCAPDVHAIKEALALALPSVQSQMENLAVDMGYTPGVLALFYKVAIGSGVAPLVIFMGVGAMTDFGPLLANPRTLLLGAAAQFGIFATVLGALTLNYFGLISFTLPQAGGHRHYRRRGRPDGDLSVGQAGAGAAGGHRGGGVLVYGAGAVNPAADYARADQRERAQNPHGAAAHGE
ncbi:oxaloacetate decarboxylase subunit beta [Salmonella enterica subsp. enterica]|uniref:oxaloacetate decarboxylase (Na(+) extruding) n=1 Tax=Salmonella enterica I TaxID=59201 RepID=A0A447TUB0_SALET|nr:oxaloacetate decarboxylase subunit beta [Salmonella enterica subsp. enterica]